jgi:gluconokinase
VPDSGYLIVVMGAPGAGKSTLGRALAARLDCPFVDGDDVHPPLNIAKLEAGIALTDDDRAPWLAEIGGLLDDWREAGSGGVVACSALKRAYRDALRSGRPQLRFVYLEADEGTLRRRVMRRRNHFIAPRLVPELLRVLEPPTPDERAIVVQTRYVDAADVAAVVAAQVEEVRAALRAG